MISETLKKVILAELKLAAWDIKAETTAGEVPGWDSLNHINVIMAVERHYQVRFKSMEVLRLKNVGDLQRLLDSKLGASK